MSIELGSRAQDKITGFEGIVTARFEWLTGCVRYEIQPIKLGLDGKVNASETFDEARIEVLAKPTAKMRSVRALGGPQDDPKQLSGPR